MPKTQEDLYRIIKEVGFPLCEAIANGIQKAVTLYPYADIAANGELVLEYLYEEKDDFQEFADIFPDLCERYGIKHLDAEKEYVSQEIKIINSQEIRRVVFNVNPDDLDRLLMNVSEVYIGYRNQGQQGGSILLLANPLLEAYKME